MNEKLTWTEYAINELVEKWWSIMSSRIMTDEEGVQLRKDLKQVGIDANDFFNVLIEKIKD